MRVPINLAREPFRRDRPVLIGSALAALLLLGSLGALVSRYTTERGDTRETQARLTRVDQRLAVTRREQAKLDASMRQTGNEIALDRSVLLNTIIRRKAISWTKIFTDLSTVQPENVRILAIRPSVNAQGGLFLDMQVAADSPEPVIGFITKLEGSDLFGSTAVSGITPPSQTNAFYRYQLSVNYDQKL